MRKEKKTKTTGDSDMLDQCKSENALRKSVRKHLNYSRPTADTSMPPKRKCSHKSVLPKQSCSSASADDANPSCLYSDGLYRGRCPKTGRCTRRDESVFLMIRCVLLTYHHSTFRQSAILCLYKFRSLCCCCTPVQVNVFIFSCYPYKFRGTNNIQNRQWPLTCLNVLLAAIQSKIANIIRVLR